MAECQEYKEMISCYVDGQLPEGGRKALMSHLEGCESCRALLSAYRGIREAAGDMLQEVPDGFSDRVMEQIRALPAVRPVQAPARRKLRPVFVSLSAAAACLVLALLAAPQLFGLRRAGLTESMSVNDVSQVEMAKTEASGSGQAYGVSIDAESAGAAEDMVMFSAAAEADAQPRETKSPDDGGAPENSAAPEAGMGLMAQPPLLPVPSEGPDAMQPATAPQPAGEAMGAFQIDEEALEEYFAVFTFKGMLPEGLSGIEKTYRDGGTYSFVIPAETARQLIRDGYTAVIGNESAENALVCYSAE